MLSLLSKWIHDVVEVKALHTCAPIARLSDVHSLTSASRNHAAPLKVSTVTLHLNSDLGWWTPTPSHWQKSNGHKHRPVIDLLPTSAFFCTLERYGRRSMRALLSRWAYLKAFHSVPHFHLLFWWCMTSRTSTGPYHTSSIHAFCSLP
jgi:hypothetical protein